MLFFIYIVLGLYVLANIFTYPLQDLFIFRPKRLRKEHVYSFHTPFEELFLDTPHQGRINLIWFRKEAPRKKVILYCHGNAGNLDRWGKIAEHFCAYGYDVLVFDYRGFGKSTGIRNERNMNLDTQAVYKLALQTYAPEDIVIYGKSMGSGVACQLAWNNQHDQLILETPFSSIRKLFTSYYPFLPGKLFFFKYSFHNDSCVKELGNKVFVFQGTRDRIVPFRCAVQLRSCLKDETHFIVIEGGKHHNLSDFKLFHERMEQLLRY